MGVGDRAVWLGAALAAGLGKLPARLRQWRREMLDCIAGITKDSVAFTHFSAINLIVGAATGSGAMISCLSGSRLGDACLGGVRTPPPDRTGYAYGLRYQGIDVTCNQPNSTLCCVKGQYLGFRRTRVFVVRVTIRFDSGRQLYGACVSLGFRETPTSTT